MNEIMHSKKTFDKLKVGMSVFQMHERKPSCTGFEFSESWTSVQSCMWGENVNVLPLFLFTRWDKKVYRILCIIITTIM